MSQQLTDVYVKIVTNPFVPMDLPVDYVYSCVEHVAKYMVAGGHATHCDADGTPSIPTWQPTLNGIEADGTSVVLGYDLVMTITDATGLTVYVDGASEAITSAAAVGSDVNITMTSAITAGQIVTVTYDADTGDLSSGGTGTKAATSFNDVLANNIT